MKKWPLLLLTAAGLSLTVRPIDINAQPARYTSANTHSHNDYEQSTPFWLAWQEGFGSIEADIWLVNGKVIIGHDTQEIKAGRTLEDYYIKPLSACIKKNGGHPYADTARHLQILIDVKEDSVAALAALIALLDKYPVLETTPSLKWVISGNRPDPDRYPGYPSFIAFDGILHDHYTPEELAHIALMSDDLHYYTRWDHTDGIPDSARHTLEQAIKSAHDLHLPVRFWDAPDFPAAWLQLVGLKVDYINTDHIDDLAVWLSADK
jgi:alkaline phosphatase